MAEKAAPAAATVLFMPNSLTSWSRMRPQIRACQESNIYDPVVLIATSAVLGIKPDCDTMKVPYRHIGPFDRQDRGSVTRFVESHETILGSRTLMQWVRRLVTNDRASSCLPIGILRGIAVRKLLLSQTEKMGRLLDEINPQAVFVQGDRELGAVPPTIHASRERNIPIVIAAPGIPSKVAMGSVRRGQPRFLTKLRDAAPLLNVLAARWLPMQACETPSGRLLFSPGWLTLTLHSLSMLSANPWCQGGGYSDRVVVDGPRKAQRFIDHGIPEEKLSIIGDLDMDVLHQGLQRQSKLRAELDVEYSLAPDRDLYIYAAPSYAEQDIMPMDQHLAKLDRVLGALSRAGQNVLISLHPKSSLEIYKPVADRYGFRILTQRLFDVMPAADLFLCGGSTTMEWAMLCKIPVIDIDYAEICDTDLEVYRSAIHITDPVDLDDLLTRFASDSGWRQELANELEEQRDSIALFDGRARNRFLEMLAALTAMTAPANRDFPTRKTATGNAVL